MRAAGVLALIALLIAGCGKNSQENTPAPAAKEPVTTREVDAGTAAAQAQYSASAFAACAVCHRPDGAGIPGAFPPIRNRAGAIAALEGGREYLQIVVAHGLMGKIQAGGENYVGVMPGHLGSMNAETMAAAINYAVFGLTDDGTVVADVKPFSAAEVEAVTSAVDSPSPTSAVNVRSDLAARHGDQWPP